jgi:hypothetical protein
LLLATENAAARIHLSQGLSEQVAVQKKLRDADHEVERMALQHLLGERRQRAVAWVELRRYAGLDCGLSKEKGQSVAQTLKCHKWRTYAS